MEEPRFKLIEPENLSGVFAIVGREEVPLACVGDFSSIDGLVSRKYMTSDEIKKSPSDAK